MEPAAEQAAEAGAGADRCTFFFSVLSTGPVLALYVRNCLSARSLGITPRLQPCTALTGFRRKITWAGGHWVGDDHGLDVLELIEVPLRYNLQLRVLHHCPLVHLHALPRTPATQIHLYDFFHNHEIYAGAFTCTWTGGDCCI